MSERLQKFLAEAGLGSRRSCEDLIRSGRVNVDGRTAWLGMSVDPVTQVVELDGHRLIREDKEYWLLNKPAGVLSAARDSRGRRTVVDIVPASGRVFPVGRLDLDSTGLLVLTNDGELAARLLHPRYHVEKEYLVTVAGAVGKTALSRLCRGVVLEDGPSFPTAVEVVHKGGDTAARGTTILRIVIQEGRKRQVRRMLEAVGHQVVRLHRSRFDGLSDSGLPVGQARRLTATELDRLRRAPASR